MKAEDTVIDLLPIDNPVVPETVLWEYVEKAVKLQAEISFKAGFNEALTTVVATREYDEGKQAGRREVVDWVKSNRETPLGEDTLGYYVWEEALQAKLKKWGL